MASFVRPANHYFPITVRTQIRGTEIAETNEGSSPDYEFGEEHGQCSRTFYTPWGTDSAIVGTIRADVLGATSIAIDKAKLYLSRTIPMEHDNFPDELFATGARISPRKGEPEGRDAQGIHCVDEAVLQVSYSQLPYRVLTDNELIEITGTYADEGTLLRYVSVDQQTAAKYQTIPAFGSLVWTHRVEYPDDGGPAPGDPVVFKNSMILFEGDLILTWHDIPFSAFPASAIAVLVGRTNSQPFGHPQSLLGQFPAETLVCGPPKRKVRHLRDGTLGYDISYPFKYYPQGANYNFHMSPSTTPGFYPMAADVFGTKKLFPLDGVGDPIKNPFQYTFEDLFRPEPTPV